MSKKYPETMEAARQWVADGKPCTFTYGVAYRGACQSRITQEEAEEKLKHHKFGLSFYTIFWRVFEGEDVLNFTEYGENDLD